LDVEGEPLCHNVGPCPHDWLLPMCCAVVHHGGAGTTAAGLRYGLPTFVCPFFADQVSYSFYFNGVVNKLVSHPHLQVYVGINGSSRRSWARTLPCQQTHNYDTRH
jgi:hypothetical protein